MLNLFGIAACHCNCWFDYQGKHLESVLSAAGDYEIWLTTQILETEDYEFTSQVLFEADTLPYGNSQPMSFDS